jgi:hypothetical protein
MIDHVWLAFTCGMFLGMFAGATVVCILVVGRKQYDCRCLEDD